MVTITIYCILLGIFCACSLGIGATLIFIVKSNHITQAKDEKKEMLECGNFRIRESSSGHKILFF